MASFWNKLKQSAIPTGMSLEDYARMQEQMKPYKRRVGWVTGYVMMMLIGGIFVFVWAEPMRAWETVPVILLLTTPLTYFLVRKQLTFLFAVLPPSDDTIASPHSALIQRSQGLGDILSWYRALKQRIPDPRLRNNLSGIVILTVAANMGLVLGSVLALNRYADSSAPQSFTIPLENKYISYGKHGSRYYKLRFATPVPSILPFAYDTHELIQTSRQNYDRAIPGQTTVTIEVHKGALGLPWYRTANHYLDGLGDSSTRSTTSEALKSACAWRDAFNLARDIEAITPQDFHRDYWPNGKMRSEEPLVNGVIHGVGHYWFDDGSVYANIPYRQGKKHGAFTLYRQDGSIEQQLSYKDGNPYGLNSWFNPDGSLQQSLIYDSAGEQHPVNDCQNIK